MLDNNLATSIVLKLHRYYVPVVTRGIAELEMGAGNQTTPVVRRRLAGEVHWHPAHWNPAWTIGGGARISENDMYVC